MSTIPISTVVDVTPNVIGAGGSALDLNGLLLTTSWRPPVGSAPSFPTAAAVASYFGASSAEASLATVYFNGFENSNVKPGSILFAQYNASAVAAYVRGGSLVSMTLAQLQALNAALSVTINGVVKSATINLSGATSFSNAGKLIQTGLGIAGPQVASITGSIAGTTLTVSAVSSGAVDVGSVLTGTGVSVGTRITALLTGTGGVGTYTVDASQTALSAAMTANAPGVFYDSVSSAFVIQSGSTGTGSTMTYGSGALGTSLALTSVTGALLSQGAAAAVPGTFMDALVAITEDWATFMNVTDPDASGNANKLLFAQWVSAQDDRYAYACWDTDVSPAAAAPAASSLGALIAAASLSGTILIGRDNTDYVALPSLAAFVCGYAASLDFSQANGRTDLDFRRQSGLVPSVTDGTAKANLIANGYNFYGAYGPAVDPFQFFEDGSISGEFLWADSFYNQIWLNNSFKIALLNLLLQSRSIPYNAAGRAMIEAALGDTIQEAVNFGAIRAGVALSSTQIAEVNAAAGVRISDTLTERGWYIQVLDATAAVRVARESPPCTFWYVDGQSVQKIDLTSVEIQ